SGCAYVIKLIGPELDAISGWLLASDCLLVRRTVGKSERRRHKAAPAPQGNILGGRYVSGYRTVKQGGGALMKRSREWAGVALAGMVLAGAVTTAPGARADEVVKTFTVTGHAQLHVQTDDGAVRVSTGDIKQVEVRVEYTGYKLDRDLHVEATQ